MAKTTKTPSKTKGSAPAAQPLVLPRKLIVGIQTVDLSTNRGTDIPLPDAAPFYYNTSIQSVRNATNAYDAMRALVKISGDFSMAVTSYVRLANTPLRYKVFDGTHQLSADGYRLLFSVLANLEYLADYTYGYDDRIPLTGVSEVMLNEVMLTGAAALEVVLDKTRLPFRLQPVSPSKLRWRIGELETGALNHKVIPWQQSQGATVMLDVPTFFSCRLDHDVTITYPKPPLESALNAAVFNAEVLEDIRRAVRQSGHSRVLVTLDTEKVAKSMPVEARGDFNQAKEWMESVRSSLESQLAALTPQSGIVVWDTAAVEYLNSQVGAAGDYGPLMDIVDSQSSTALRTPPSILGKRMSGGSQNISSSESLLFLKHVEGVRRPVQAVWSRALTLVLRMYGFEGYVQAVYEPVNLRPEAELEAFKQMRQSRVLELLSLGFLTDQEAAYELGTGLLAPTAQPMSGTRFYQAGKAAMDPAAVANGGDPAKRALTGDAPKKSGGASQ